MFISFANKSTGKKSIQFIHPRDTLNSGERYLFHFENFGFDSSIIFYSLPNYLTVRNKIYNIHPPVSSLLNLNNSTLFFEVANLQQVRSKPETVQFFMLKDNGILLDTLFRKKFIICNPNIENLPENHYLQTKDLILQLGDITLDDIFTRKVVKKKWLLHNLKKQVQIYNRKNISKKLVFLDFVKIEINEKYETAILQDIDRNDRFVLKRLKKHLKRMQTGNLTFHVEAYDPVSGVLYPFLNGRIWFK